MSGKLLKAQDSTAVMGTVQYEKLPYYDDMGFAQSSSDGMFQMNLYDGTTYNFKVEKNGFITLEQEIDVSKNEEIVLYIKEDLVELIKLDNLIFRPASADITSGSFQELDDLAKWMNDNPQIIIQLEGHTDFRGNADANMRLSQARVDAVKEYLEDKKVKDKRILTKAFGGTQPLTREDTPEAHAVNRRVEVRVLKR